MENSRTNTRAAAGASLAAVKRIYSDHVPEPIGKHKFYSVLVPFVEKDGRLFLLLEKRARDMLSQPNEICFPGGHFEKGEAALDCVCARLKRRSAWSAATLASSAKGTCFAGTRTTLCLR